MDNTKWQNVLIEWVNCLKLCKSIQNINELRSGEFFANIQKVITKSREVNCDILSFIFELISKHYPNYVIEDKKEIHLNDLPEWDLRAITSLLMHYTCIYDRRDILTSPLCHSLSQSTQLIIRNFLEKITKDITNATINNVIKSCIDDASDHVTNQWLLVGTCSSKNSPLQDLLKTPVSKFGRLQEKDKMISKLKSDLEVERYEKADLQDELTLQREKNKKIEHQLQQKADEISRLRTEVLELEGRTPPHYQDMDSRDLQRRLRAEIQSLEDYIKQVENEQEEIRREKDAAKERLRKIESESTMWQEKFFETERNFERLSEHSKRQEEELRGLQEHCSELTFMLEEFKTKPPNDSSYFESFSVKSLNVTPPCDEDLACSVVEVQLRDAQKQNDELKAQICQIEQVCAQLRQKIDDVTEDLRKSRCLNDELANKMKLLESDNAVIKVTLNETEENYEKSVKRSEELERESNNLSQQLKETLEMLDDSKKLVQKLENIQLDLESQLQENCEYSEKLKTEIEKIQYEKVKLSKEFEETKLKLEHDRSSLRTKLKQSEKFCGDLENKNELLEYEIEGLQKKSLDLINGQNALETQLSECQNNLETLKIELNIIRTQEQKIRKELFATKAYLEEEKEKLKESESLHKYLAEENNNLMIQNDNLLLELEKSKDVSNTLVKQLHDSETQSEKLSNQLQQTNQTLKEVNEISTILEEEKESLILKLQHLEEKREQLEIKNEELLTQIEKLQSLLSNMISDVETSRKETDELKETKNVLESKLSQSESEKETILLKSNNLEKENRELSIQITNFQKELLESSNALDFEKTETEKIRSVCNELETKLNQRESQISELKDNLEKLQNENERISGENYSLVKKNDEFNNIVQNLNKKINEDVLKLNTTENSLKELNEAKNKLETELDQICLLSDELRLKNEKLEIENEKINEELNTVVKLVKKFEDERNALNAKIILLEKKNEQLLSAIQTYQKQLVDATNNLELTEKELQQVKNLHCTSESQLEHFKIENESLKNDFGESKKNCKMLEDEKEALLTKIQQLEGEVENMQKQLSNTTKQSEELKNIQNMLEKQLKERTQKIEELQLENQRINEQQNATDNNLKKVEEEKIELLEQLREFEEKCNKLKTESQELKTTINSLEKDKDMFTTKLQESENKYENSNQQLIETLNTLEITNKQLEELKEEVKNLVSTKTSLEKEITETNDSLKTITASKVSSETEYQQIKDRLNDSLVSNRRFQQLLEETRKEKEDLLLQMQQTNEKINIIETENGKLLYYKKDLETKLKEAIEELDEINQKSLKLRESKSCSDRQAKEATTLAEVLKMEFEDVQISKRKLEAQLEKVQSEREELVSSIEDYKKEISQKAREILELQTMKNNDEELIETLKRDSEEVQSNLESQLDEANTLIEQLKSELEVVNCKCSEKEKKFELVEKKVEELEKLREQLNFEIGDLMKMLEDAKLKQEERKMEIATLQEKLEKVNEEKQSLEKKIEIDEFVASEKQEKMKALEETVQDYEITISGLRSVIDSNLESLEVLKDAKNKLFDELLNVKNKEQEIATAVINIFKDNNIICCEDIKEIDLKDFISEHLLKILVIKKKEETELVKQIEELKKEIELNSTIKEIFEKLQVLVLINSEVDNVENLKSNFENIVVKITEVLQANEKLSEDFVKLENEKSDVVKQFDALKCENEEVQNVNGKLEKSLAEEQEKVKNLSRELENLNKIKSTKVEKENILGVSTKANKFREEELKKENAALKKKIVLTEHAKSNLEKVLKDLREEKKKGKTNENPSSPTYNDVLYKRLLQDYIQVKEEHEKVVKEKDLKYEMLMRENEELKNKKFGVVKNEDDKKLTLDLHNIREAYGNVMSINSKLELEIVTLRKVIEERNTEIANLSHVKEAYEKLLEENNKLLTEIDTIKYKRTRDKDEFLRLLKKEREEVSNKETTRVQDIRAEYEGKLEKMKEKMLKLYREEVNKKVKSLKESENSTLFKTIANLKTELMEAEQKIQLLEMEREIFKANKKIEADNKILPLQTVSSVTTITTRSEDRATTLPRPTITEEVRVSRRTSVGGIPTSIGQNLHMEDEEDLFNDKYLSDLKEGRCTLPSNNRESTASRFSELAWRNSLVPPHLKSSYPAELQFVSPTRFKDEDIKVGNIELDDSSCKLLPGEKPRKKDFGTTSYKKPGPPTPSKNGGRLSLQGNEVHPMREHHEVKTPKKSTPNRIRALFTGRNNNTKENSEVNITPNRGRRLNIFRRPR